MLARGHAAVATLGPVRATRAETALLDGATAHEAAALASTASGIAGALVQELTRRALVQAGRA